MLYLSEILFGVIRIFLLLFTTLLSYYLGSAVYHNVNTFLYANSLPCVEVIAFLLSAVPVFFVFFGIGIQKYFWQRPGHYNWVILLVSYAIGAVISFLPLNTLFASSLATNPCPEQVTLVARIAHALASGLLTSVLAFAGMDLGVSLKHVSHRIRRKSSKKKK